LARGREAPPRFSHLTAVRPTQIAHYDAIALKDKPTAEPAAKRMGAIDAAAQVLAEAAEPLSAKQMIERMTAQKLWNSPGGKTPEATLYAAIVREIAAKGRAARFVKVDRGRFIAHS